VRKLWLAIALTGISSAQSGVPMLTSEADVQAVSFSKDGITVAGVGADNKVRLWDARSGALRKTVPLGPEEKVAAIPSGTDLIAVAAKDGTIELRDLETGRRSKQFPAVVRGSRRLAVSPDGTVLARSTRLAGNSRDEMMRLWDSSGKEQFAVPSGIGGTSALAVSPDARILAAGSYDTDVRIWNTRDGELVRRIDDVLVATFAMAFTPDGKFLVTGGVDRALYFWDTSTWKLARKLSGQPEMISAIAIAPGGGLIATGGYNELTQENPVKVLLWDTSTNAVVRSLDAPRIVGSLAFSPDGKRLAAACGKKSVQIWNVEAK
jgi:WD40 repeat protein